MRLAIWLLLGGCIAMPGPDPVRVTYSGLVDTDVSPQGQLCGTGTAQVVTFRLQNPFDFEVAAYEVTGDCHEVFVTWAPAFGETSLTSNVGRALVFGMRTGTTWGGGW